MSLNRAASIQRCARRDKTKFTSHASYKDAVSKLAIKLHNSIFSAGARMPYEFLEVVFNCILVEYKYAERSHVKRTPWNLVGKRISGGHR